MKTDEEIYDIRNKIAEKLLAYHDYIEEVVSDFSDEEILQLAKDYKEKNDSSLFRIYEYDEIAERLEAEVGKRCILKDANKYAKETGGGFYCVTCKGACESEEKHEKNCDKLYDDEYYNDEHCELRKLSIEQLIKEIIRLRKLITI